MHTVETQVKDDLVPSGSEELLRTLEAAALTVLAGSALDEAVELTLALTDDAEIQELNLQYLGIDAPTDVLSFPAGEKDPESGALYLGDVVLSYPRAAEQAAAGGHPVAAELQLLVVHGVLHLLGHDHAEVQEKQQMWALQERFLEQLHCPARPLE